MFDKKHKKIDKTKTQIIKYQPKPIIKYKKNPLVRLLDILYQGTA